MAVRAVSFPSLPAYSILYEALAQPSFPYKIRLNLDYDTVILFECQTIFQVEQMLYMENIFG